MKTYSIIAIETNQKYNLGLGKKIYTGKIKITELLDPKDHDNKDARFKIHKWKHDQIDPKGYQRFPHQGRIDNIKKYLQVDVKEPIFPTAILVNARTPLSFKESKEKDFKGIGRLLINQTLYVIDGQHRIEAFKQIMQNRELAELYGFIELPIIILSNFNYKEEVEQFYVINSRQKRIKTDLAQRILVEMSKEDISTGLIPEKNRWYLPAITIIDELNQNILSEWYGLISLPDDEGDIRKERTISQNSFVKSLGPLFVGPTQKWNYNQKNGRKIVEECQSLLNDYWDMIKEVYGESFKNKKGSILFKTAGVFSLHIVLAKYMEDHPALNKKDVISKIKKLLLIARDTNKIDCNFWMSGNQRAREKGINAGAYSSSAGHNRIAIAILQKTNPLNFR